MASPKIFVSHCSKDRPFCIALTESLRRSGADVWYDEDDLGSQPIYDTIDRELRARPIFFVMLSPDALKSPWVHDECKWAYMLYKRERSRSIIPILAQPLDVNDIWLLLSDFPRIGEAGGRPLPLDAALRHAHQRIALAYNGVSAELTITTSSSADDLLAQGKGLLAQKQYTAALPFFEQTTQRDPAQMEGWYNLALTRRWLFAYDQALQASERAIALDHSSAAAWAMKSQILTEMGRLSEAATACNQAISIDPGDATALTAKGSILNVQGRYEEALSIFDQALALTKSDPYIWACKGMALATLRRYDEAQASTEEALALDPRYAVARAIQAGIAFSLHELDRAARLADEAIGFDAKEQAAWVIKGIVLLQLGERSRGQEALRQAVALTPRSAFAWIDKGTALYFLERPAAALIAFDEALKVSSQLRGAWIGKGFAYFSLGEVDQALAASLEAIKLGPTDPEATQLRGIVLCNAGQYEKAAQILDQSLTQDPKNFFSWAWKCVALVSLGNVAQGLEASERSLELEPKNLLALIWKARALLLLERYADALVACDAIEASFEKDTKPQDIAICWFYREQAYEGLKQPAEALKAIDAALFFDDGARLFWATKGQLLINAERYQEALAAYERASQLEQKPDDDPPLAFIWYRRGYVHFKLDQFNEALKMSVRALELNAQFGPGWLLRGAALKELKRYDEALPALDEAIRLNPADGEAIALRRSVLNEQKPWWQKLIQAHGSPACKQENRTRSGAPSDL